jgi:hypothetical protein
MAPPHGGRDSCDDFSVGLRPPDSAVALVWGLTRMPAPCLLTAFSPGPEASPPDDPHLCPSLVSLIVADIDADSL